MDSSATQQVELITKIISKNKRIAHLTNCVSCGRMTKSGYVCGSNNSNDTKSWIRIVRLNKVFITNFLQWQNSYHYRNATDSNMYINLYNKHYFRKKNYTGQYLGVNVFKDLNINGYHYNLSDIYSSYLIEGTTNAYLPYYCYHIYKFLFVGDKNYLIGFVDVHGVLYLDYVLLNTIKNYSDENYHEVVTRIISVYSNINILFFENNIENIDGLTKQLEDHLKHLILKNISSCADECTIIDPNKIDIFSDYPMVDNLIEKMRSMVSEEIKVYLDKTSWGIDNYYSFTNIISDVLCNSLKVKNNELDNAFTKGLLFGKKLELGGWNISTKKFDDSSKLVWEKEVSIVPTRVYYLNKMYNIINDDTWTNPFHVNKIYISVDGNMYCDGTHPNVSSQHVCMGDISGKISLNDPKTLGENLNRCESLLTLINYDSSYSSLYRDLILEHSKLDPFSSFEIDKEYIGDNESLTDVSFETDEEIDEDIESPEKETGIEII